MRKLLLGAVLMLPALAKAGGNVVGGITSRKMSDNLFGEFDSQTGIAILADFGFGESPVNLAVGLTATGKDEEDPDFGDTSVGVADIMVGAKFMGHSGVFRPYGELGVTSTGVSYEDDEDDASDQGFGFYLAGGALFRIGSHFDLGVDIRQVLGGSVELFGTDLDTDSLSVSLLAGFGWGK